METAAAMEFLLAPYNRRWLRYGFDGRIADMTNKRDFHVTRAHTRAPIIVIYFFFFIITIDRLVFLPLKYSFLRTRIIIFGRMNSDQGSNERSDTI